METKIEEQKIILHPELQERGQIEYKPLSSNFKQKTYYCSSDMNTHFISGLEGMPVLQGYYKAYANHIPICINPDILWMLVVQGFSRHIEKNAEKLRKRFVQFEGKKDLLLETDERELEDFTKETWEKYFKFYVDEMRKHVGGMMIAALTPCFSTTTEVIQNASMVAIMSCFKSYFRFKGLCGGCGFPYINLQGTLMDYMQLKFKLQGLLTYEIDDWINVLIPIIDKIIETKQGNVDTEFWNNMIKNAKKDEMGSGAMVSVDAISGWLLNFYPFFKVNEGMSDEELEDNLSSIIENSGQGWMKRYYEQYHRLPVGMHVEQNRMKLRTEFNSTLTMSEIAKFPDEIIDATMEMKNVITGEENELSCKTGFLGANRNNNGEIVPTIGYFICEKSS